MLRNPMPKDIRRSCLIHARLLDGFIALIEREIAMLEPGDFAEESLRESLEIMRCDRRRYGIEAAFQVIDGTRPPLVTAAASA